MSISLKAIDTRVTALENKIINSGYMVPDWSKTVRKDNVTSPFIATEHCLVQAERIITRGEYTTAINGVNVGRTYYDYNARTMHDYELQKGDKLSNTTGSWETLFVTPMKAMNL